MNSAISSSKKCPPGILESEDNNSVIYSQDVGLKTRLARGSFQRVTVVAQCGVFRKTLCCLRRIKTCLVLVFLFGSVYHYEVAMLCNMQDY